jgi:PST family polysaccharide transporter
MSEENLPRMAVWSVGCRAATTAFRFAISIVLARLLLPEMYGLVGMVTAVTSLASVIVETGFGPAIIQRKELDRPTLDAAFSASLLLGAATTLLLVLVAPAVSAFYGRPALTLLTRVSALSFLVSAVATVPRALALRRMSIRGVALVEVAGALLSGAGSVAMAMTGWEVWALVLPPLAGSLVEALLLLRLGRYGPALTSRMQAARPLLGLSLTVLGFAVVNYCARWTDNLVIGYYLGERELGFYVRAYTLMLLPLTQLTGVLGNALVPALSRAQDDHDQSRRLYLRATGLIGLVSFPVMAGASALAAPLVSVLFGPRWGPVAPILTLLAPVGALQAVLPSVAWLYVAQARTDLLLKWGIVSSAVYVASFLCGAWLGSGACVAATYLIANCALVAPGLLAAGRLVGIGRDDYARRLLPTAGAAAAMAIGVALLDRLVAGTWSDAQRLLLGTVAGAVAYTAAVVWLEPPSLRDAVGFVVRTVGPVLPPRVVAAAEKFASE